MLKEQHIMPRSKEIQEQMTNKIVDIYQSGKGYLAKGNRHFWSKRTQARLTFAKIYLDYPQ